MAEKYRFAVFHGIGYQGHSWKFIWGAGCIIKGKGTSLPPTGRNKNGVIVKYTFLYMYTSLFSLFPFFFGGGGGKGLPLLPEYARQRQGREGRQGWEKLTLLLFAHE